MGKGSGGLSPNVGSSLTSNASALETLAGQQAQQGQQLFNLALPGYEQAQQYYGAIASGSPYAISTATAPAIAQIAASTQGAKQNILQNAPAGGEKNLAIEQADVNQGAQVGQVTTGAYGGAQNALGQLAGQGIGQSQGAAGTAISGFGAGTSAISNLGNLQMQQYQIEQQAKGSTLGALASLGGGIAEGAGAAGGLGALFAL